jgi:hypothetical protein
MAAPLFWLLGFNIIAAATLVALLSLRMRLWRFPLPPYSVSWIVVGCAQAISICLNIISQRGTLGEACRHLVGLGVTGWIMLGLIFAIGSAGGVDNKRLVRGHMILGLWMLALTAVSFGAWRAGLPSLETPTAFSAALGSKTSAQFRAIFYISENSFGRELPRLILLYPWPTALGVGGLGMVLMSFAERARIWRTIGLLGGLTVLILSFSRAAYVALPVSLAAYAALRRPRLIPLAICAMITLVSSVLLTQRDPLQFFGNASSGFDAAREGSSAARELMNRASWQEFLSQPILGHGWVGESVHRIQFLPIGSHSSFYGTLYTGGLLTFLPLLAAGLITLGFAVRSALQGAQSGAISAAVLIGLWIIAYGESLYSIVLCCVGIFLYVGSGLRPSHRKHERMLNARSVYRHSGLQCGTVHSRSGHVGSTTDR